MLTLQNNESSFFFKATHQTLAQTSIRPNTFLDYFNKRQTHEQINITSAKLFGLVCIIRIRDPLAG